MPDISYFRGAATGSGLYPDVTHETGRPIAANTSTMTPGPDLLVASLIHAPRGHQLILVGIVHGASSVSTRVGIYTQTNDLDMRPASLVFDCGVLTGESTVTAAVVADLDPGPYWVGCLTNSGLTSWLCDNQDSDTFSPLGLAADLATFQVGWKANWSYASGLPATFPPPRPTAQAPHLILRFGS